MLSSLLRVVVGFLVSLGVCVPVSFAAVAEPPMRLVRVTAEDSVAFAESLHEEGIDCSAWDLGDGRFDVIVTEAQQMRLVLLGFDVELVRRGRPLRAAARGVGDGYPDLGAIYARMQAAAARRPDICAFVDLTDRYGTPTTTEGRRLYAIRISDNVGVDEAEPAVLIVTTHHAREVGTPLVGLEAIDRLVDGHGVDPDITGAVDGHEIWIAPMWNPDGYQYVFDVDDFWRKNRAVNPDTTVGIDLNRNYPVGWGQCGGSQNTGSPTYEGPAPGSESETQTMLAFAEDRRFARVADVHSFASEVRYGYGCWDHPWDNSFGVAAAVLSAISGYGAQTRSSCCLGGDIHLHTNRYGSLALLWEIGDSFQPSFKDAQAEAEQVWPAMLDLITRGNPIQGRVTHELTGEPVETEIEIVGAGFANNERHGSALRHGLFHVHAPAGSWTLRFSAEGFAVTEIAAASAFPDAGEPLDVHMVPLCGPDLAAPFGSLNFFDVSAFITLYIAGDLGADFAAPFGVLNFFDVAEFIAAFNAGCP